MGVYSIGDFIKRTRKSMGIPRKELCDDICSVETLCRIENGKQNPNRYTYRMLMNRMGETGEKYQLYIHGDEDTIIEWEKLSLLAASRRYKELDRTLEEFENSVDMGDTLNKQFVLRMRAITDYRLGRIDLLQERNLLLQAIKYTIPDFNSKVIPNRMFTRYEIALICNIAATYEIEDINTSISILKQLSEYFKNIKVDDEERSLSEVFVLLNLAKFLGIQGRQKKYKVCYWTFVLKGVKGVIWQVYSITWPMKKKYWAWRSLFLKNTYYKPIMPPAYAIMTT